MANLIESDLISEIDSVMMSRLSEELKIKKEHV